MPLIAGGQAWCRSLVCGIAIRNPVQEISQKPVSKNPEDILYYPKKCTARLALFFFALLMLGANLFAQSIDRVIHLWVDPHYGNDITAVINGTNPNGSLNCGFFPTFPNMP